MLINDQKLDEVLTEINKIFSKLQKRIKDLEDAEKERTSQRQSTSQSNSVRKKG
jgi:hypothetical protein